MPKQNVRKVPAGKVDFAALGLPEYKSAFAIVLDNLFKPSELSQFLATAEASSPWDIARVNTSASVSHVDTSYRNGDRIIYDDFEMSRVIFERIRPHLKEIEEFEEKRWRKKEMVVVARKRMVRMNERLRFLRYSQGGFFKPHCDGEYVTPDRKQRTYYTVQLYLPSSADGTAQSMLPAEGGATRFHTWSDDEETYCDVEPIPGRVLVFQHDDLLHSGEEVTGGVKCTLRSDILFETVAD